MVGSYGSNLLNYQAVGVCQCRFDSSLQFLGASNLLIQLRKFGDMVGRVGIEPTTN